MTATKSAAVFISGGGSNLQAFIDAAQHDVLGFQLQAVFSNRADAGGLLRAEKAGIETCVIPSRGVSDRETYDQALASKLDRFAPDLIILAGFMRILSAGFVNRYAGRILNIHPSLLPLYPGLDTHARALAAGDSQHGCTVHFVTEELDGGPRIMQGAVDVLKGESAETLAGRVLEVEHRVYPRAAGLVAAERISYRDGRCYLDGELLSEPMRYTE